MQIILRTKVPYQVILEAETIFMDKLNEETYNFVIGYNGDEYGLAHPLIHKESIANLDTFDPKVFLEIPSLPGFYHGLLEVDNGTRVVRMGWKTDMNDFTTINYVYPGMDVPEDTVVDLFIAYTGRRRYFLNECDDADGTLVSRALEMIGITLMVRPCEDETNVILDFQYNFGYGAYSSHAMVAEIPYVYTTSNKAMHWWENQVTYLRRLGHPAQLAFISENIDKITVKTLRTVSAGEVNEEQLTLSTVLLDVVSNDEDSLYITELSAYLRQLQSKLS